MPKSDLRKAAAELVEKCPEAPSRTLAKRLAAEFGVPLEQARTAIRLVRGQMGARDRKYAEAPTRARTQRDHVRCPPSLAEAWLPFELPGKRVLILSDIHVPYHDQRVLERAVKWGRDWRPDVVLLNGDYGDFYTISRFLRNPKQRDLRRELELQRAGLQWLRESFPKARIVLKLGNHDERWDHWLWQHAPELFGEDFLRLDNVLKLGEVGIEMIGDQRPIMLGKLPVLHGHELPRGISSPVNAARGAYLRTAHTVLVGHSHHTSGHSNPDMWHSEVFCWSTGCLCELSPPYARINKWNHGFAAVSVSAGGSFAVENMRISAEGEVRA